MMTRRNNVAMRESNEITWIRFEDEVKYFS